MIKMIAMGLGLAIFSFCSLESKAVSSVAGISGASDSIIGVSPINTKIYGGFVINGNCTQNNVSTCNTCDGQCAAGGFCPCNQTAIYPNLNLSVNFKSTIDLGGRVVLYQLSTQTTATAVGAALTSGSKSFNLSIPWSTLCGGTAGLTSSCAGAAGGTVNITVGPSQTTSTTVFDSAEQVVLEIRIGVVDRLSATPYYTPCSAGNGAAGSGICYYKIERGDGKVYVNIEDTQRGSDFPAAGTGIAGIEYSDLLFFYSENKTLAQLTNADNAADLQISASGNNFIFQDKITGLSNDTQYCFILGNADVTGNIHSFQNPAAAGINTRVCATPSLVQGLLDDKKCFIATAAFGSEMDPHVDLLRQFRARILMPTVWGTKFVKFYYDHSSMWAQKIRHSEISRAVVRGFLWPLVGFAALSLELGMPMALGIIFLILTMMGLFIFWRKKKISQVLAKFSFFIFVSLLSANFLTPSSAQAQTADPATTASPTNDDFEEGGVPPEPTPYVDSGVDEFSEDNTPVQKPVENEPSQKVQETQSLVEPSVIAAPESTARIAPYKVPKTPQTQEGRELGHEKIHHPMSEKGLLTIEKDGTYYYEPVKFETKNESISFRAGGIQPPPNIVGPDGRTNYDAIYGSSPAEISVDYEWYPFVKWGKLGLQGGVGFFTSTGNGRFAYSATNSANNCNSSVEDCTAREKYTFYGIPVSLGIIYRLQVADRPYFAPYVVGGGSYYLLAEKRDDGKPFKGVGTAAGYGGGGVMFNISAFDRTTAFTLESEYGLHNVWISADYRYIASLSKVLDVSSSIISLGIVMDY